MLTHDTAEEVREDDYPEQWQAAGEGLTFPISYHFEPGAADDGLTIDVPVATLNRVAADDFSWNVPGLREELVTSLIRSLPKQLRVSFVPAPDKAREFLAAVPPGEEPLLDALERHLRVDDRRGGPARGLGLDQGARAPAADLPGASTRPAASRRAARTSTRSRRRCGRSSRRRWPRSPTTAAHRTGQTAWTFGSIERSCTQTPRRPRGARLSRRWSTRAPRSGSGSSAPPARRRRGTGSAYAGCCCSSSRARRPAVARRARQRREARASPARRTPRSPSCSRTAGAAVLLDVVDARPPVRDEAAYDALLAAAARRTRGRGCATCWPT